MSGRGHRGPIAPSDVPDRAASSLVMKAAAIGHRSNNTAVKVKCRVKVRVRMLHGCAGSNSPLFHARRHSTRAEVTLGSEGAARSPYLLAKLLALKAATPALARRGGLKPHGPTPVGSISTPPSSLLQNPFGRLVPLAAPHNLAAPPTTPARKHCFSTARSLILRYGTTVC